MSIVTENADKIRKYYMDMARGYHVQATLNQRGRGLPTLPRPPTDTHQTVTYPQTLHDISGKKRPPKKKKTKKAVKRPGRPARAQSGKGGRGGKKTKKRKQQKKKKTKSKPAYKDSLS